MGLLQWVFEHIDNLGVIVGLFFTAWALHTDAKTRRVENQLTLTRNHRELWQVFYQGHDLSRILDASADTKALPIQLSEQVYVTEMIHHLLSVFRAAKSDLTIKPEKMNQDVAVFFALPIQRAIWEKVKPLQDKDFVAFVESCLHPK